MNKKIQQITLLSLTLLTASQLSQAAVTSSSAANKSKTITAQVQQEQPSLIAKAVEKKHLRNENSTQNLQLFASIQATPSQNFLAEQNQRFTRFIQAIFS